MEGYPAMTAGGQYLEMASEFPCSSPPSSFPPKPRPIKYRSTCDNCHRLKVKCGQEKESCSRCRASGEKCVYGISQRRGKPKSVRDAAAARRAVKLAHHSLPIHGGPAPFDFSHMGETMVFQMQLPSPSSPPPPVQHHALQPHRFAGTEPGIGDYTLLQSISLPELPWETIMAADPVRGRSASPGAGAGDYAQRRPSQADDLSCSPPHSATGSGSGCSQLDTIYAASVSTHVAESIPETTDQSSLSFSVPPPAPASSTLSHPQPSNHCRHEALLLERLVRIEATANTLSQLAPDAARADEADENRVRKPPLSFEQLLSIGQSTLPPATVSNILACDSCASNSSITLYFVLLIDKVLALHAKFIESYRPTSSGTDLASSLKSAPSTPASSVSTPSASWPSPNPLAIVPASPQSVKGAPAPFLEAYGLSSTEQTAVQKLLLKSRLGDLRSLISKLQSRMKGAGNMQQACESIVAQVGERLDAVDEDMNGVL
ncbi:hypothetical protein QBC47DRAFT_136387 [Echria macrotheca]|uniref:Zn(2)-C6 fungal-type domain-containing protein n=1 Tax=Echria macrotheca TaxID=438768 RepID=A0AAJ0F7S9_9PEZI|nr:hypothetical protein QBC47DRAFT_136387 [Echria macrotheca]